MQTHLETKNLRLRPLTSDDFEAVHAWASNPDNVRYMIWGPNDEQATRDFLAKTVSGEDFGVELKSTGRLIGSCGIYPDGDECMNVGWILHKDFHRQGYGTEICQALLRYGFEDLGIRRIIATCAAPNYPSYRVMERNGMRREAVHKSAVRKRSDGSWIDQYLYALLKDEYQGEIMEELPLYLDLTVLDCPDVEALAEFYRAMLGWQLDFITDDLLYARIASPAGQRLLFQRNDRFERPLWPEQENAQQAQSHLDFIVRSQAELARQVERAVALGATQPKEQYGYCEDSATYDWLTLLDPVGHPFCLVVNEVKMEE